MNISGDHKIDLKRAVLIDTWWNVNVDYDGLVLRVEQSFNRYMVECEFFRR